MISSDPESRLSAPGTQYAASARLGIFGGSFNPIHNGHLGIARQAVDALQLDRLLFIPTADPPHKREGTLAPAQDRYEMVRLAIAGNPVFEISDIELTRPGKSYSIDTVRELQRRCDQNTQLYFLIGLDAFLDLPTWKEPRALLEACRFVVLSRPGTSFRSLSAMALLPKIPTRTLVSLDSGDCHRLDIPLQAGPGIICLHLAPSPISASDIRQRIKRGAALANLLPPPVESFIIRHRLYQEDPDRTNI